MPHIIPLTTHRDTVKRLIHEPGGGATLQEFTKAGRVEISLTAEEFEVVRTSCGLPDCDCTGREARALDALAAREPDVRSINLDLDTLLLREDNDDIPF